MTVKTFIDRPILSGVISVAIIIVGLIGLSQLPIEQFPDIAPPTVRVTATYTGSASISVYFRQGTDPDMSVVNVQNRVASAQGLLPAEVTKSGVTVRKRQNSTLKSLSLYAPEDAYDANFLTNYMKINIEPQMSRIAGVGEVNIWGASYSMRIWLDPLKMAQYHLVPADISTVLAEQNVESPTGTLGAESTNTFQYVLKYRGRYEEERDYENMVIKSLPNGDVLRLKDVARVELGAENYALLSQTDGHPGANCMIAQTSGSNANEIIKEIDATAAEISTDLPKGMVLADIMSTKDFLDASIANVIETLLLAIVLVIGTVVDNAIVVVEAVQAKFDEGYSSSYRAAVDALDGLTSALVTTTIVFMAVFIPVCFMGGTTGTF